ncbi:hypothetical protein BS78_03G377800 [Paspalum vaginatum]|nr:hypothetical protein BS78_03G377800 [Paspalum vaginatum]
MPTQLLLPQVQAPLPIPQVWVPKDLPTVFFPKSSRHKISPLSRPHSPGLSATRSHGVMLPPLPSSPKSGRHKTLFLLLPYSTPAMRSSTACCHTKFSSLETKHNVELIFSNFL